MRARDVRHTTGVDTQRAERDLGAVLVDAGFDVDLDAPDHELRALFTADDCFLGWHVADSVRDYGTRKPTDRPFFQPGSMDPLLARAACNLARVTPGDRVLDPMCGTGGVLIEAGLLGAHPIGTDAQAKMAAGARRNLTHYVDDATTGRADATALPLPSDSIDAAVLDAPYGRQSKIATHDLADLVGGTRRARPRHRRPVRARRRPRLARRSHRRGLDRRRTLPAPRPPVARPPHPRVGVVTTGSGRRARRPPATR